MADSYPYMLSNNKIEPILTKIRSAAKPEKFTHAFLKQLGFSSSNDRAVIPLFKRLGFITEDGAPTEYYDRLRDGTDWQYVLGERVSDLYKELFNINTEIYKESDEEIKGAISRTTGKDDTSVSRYLATFKTLVSLAKFGASPKLSKPTPHKEVEVSETPKETSKPKLEGEVEAYSSKLSFHHNIEIHLPATTDVSVYNSIFKSLRENLLD